MHLPSCLSFKREYYSSAMISLNAAFPSGVLHPFFHIIDTAAKLHISITDL